MYLKFVGQHNIPETAVRVWRRYLKLESNDVEDYIDYLRRINRLDEAAQKLATVVNDVCALPLVKTIAPPCGNRIGSVRKAAHR